MSSAQLRKTTSSTMPIAVRLADLAAASTRCPVAVPPVNMPGPPWPQVSRGPDSLSSVTMPPVAS